MKTREELLAAAREEAGSEEKEQAFRDKLVEVQEEHLALMAEDQKMKAEVEKKLLEPEPAEEVPAEPASNPFGSL